MKTVLPETTADDGRGHAADSVFLRRKRTSEGEVHTQSAEKSRRDFVSVDVLGRTGICQVKAERHEGGHLLEGAGIALPIEEVGVGKIGGVFKSSIVEHDHNQAVGVAVGERGQDNAFDHAEDGGVRADAEGEGEDRDGGESGRAREEAQGVADVLPKGVHLPERSYSIMRIRIETVAYASGSDSDSDSDSDSENGRLRFRFSFGRFGVVEFVLGAAFEDFAIVRADFAIAAASLFGSGKITHACRSDVAGAVGLLAFDYLEPSIDCHALEAAHA